MKAKVGPKSVVLTYQVKRKEHPKFLEMYDKYCKSGLAFNFYNGGTREDSWIAAKELPKVR